MTGICANPLFQPQCPLDRSSADGSKVKNQSPLMPATDGQGRRWFDEIRKVEKNLPFWRNIG
jgi:hypothetical protein